MNPVELTSVEIYCGGVRMRSPRDDDIGPLMAVYDDSFNLDPRRREVTDLVTARERVLKERIRGMRRPRDRFDWHVELIVETEPGAIVGWASLYPQNESSWDVLETTTWIALGQRGKHHSREIRRGLLALAFDALGAQVAVSRAQANSPSNGTSSHLGYRTTSPIPDRDGYLNWFLYKSDWEAKGPSGIEVIGHESFLKWLKQQ